MPGFTPSWMNPIGLWNRPNMKSKPIPRPSTPNSKRAKRYNEISCPRQIPRIPGWEIAVYFHPARQVSGDFYDAFLLPGNRLGLVIADVCDKGVGSALFMALFRSLIRVFSGQITLQGVSVPGTDKNGRPTTR